MKYLLLTILALYSADLYSQNLVPDPGFENWQDRWKCLLKFPQVQDFLDMNQNSALPTRPQYEQVLEFIKQYPKTIADVNKI